MAYSVGIGDRHEDARYRATSTSTSSDESSFSFYNPPLRANNVNRLSAHMPATSDSRALLQRRFTTQGVATMSSLSNMAQLRRQPVDPPIHDASFSVRKLTTLLSFTIYRDAISPLGSYFSPYSSHAPRCFTLLHTLRASLPRSYPDSRSLVTCSLPLALSHGPC